MVKNSVHPNITFRLCAILFAILAVGSLHAASPSSGHVNAATGSTFSWDGTATGSGSADESTCVDGVNCDVFMLNVDAGDYTGKIVQVEIQWTVPANDYDLYIHQGDLNGPVVATSAGGAPETSEIGAIDPTATGPGLYTVHVVYFATTPDAGQYHGSATTQVKPATRTANYIDGAKLSPPLAFSPSKPLKAPADLSDGEPSNRTDFKGNAYIVGIRGFPAGVDLWYYDLRPGSPNYDPNARNPIYRFQPDAFSPINPIELGGDGGGDVDLAVGFANPSVGGAPFFAFSSLIAFNVSTGNSTDRAQHYMRNPVGNLSGGVPIDDRQWNAAFGANSVYLLYRTIAPVVGFIHRSDDSGFSYGPAVSLGPTSQTGGIDVNQKTGTVYASFGDGRVAVGDPAGPGLPPVTYNFHQAATDPNGVNHIFCTVKVAEGGNASPDGVVYVVYSNDHDVFLVHSTDKGVTWSTPVRVSNIPGGTNIFPWMEVGEGSSQNSVGIVFYGTTSATNDDSANWKTYYAFSSNATDAQPTFAQVAASDHFIHGSNISEGGLTGTANRNLLDYLQVSFDPAGAAVIGYTDDHNDFFGNCYGTRQISGPSIKGGNVPAATEGTLVRLSNPDVQPPQQPAPDGAQVTDFQADVTDGLLVRVPQTDQFAGTLDIHEIKYRSGFNKKIGHFIEATMTTGDIDPTLDASWRMNFTVNAPFSTLSASTDLTSGQPDYTFGLSDRGDQFWVRANSQPKSVNRTFTYGTAVRNSDGSITNTQVGQADFGKIKAGPSNTVRIQVSWDKLNAILAARGHPLIGSGTTLVGLRGSAFTTQTGLVREDDTYGGTQFTIP